MHKRVVVTLWATAIAGVSAQTASLFLPIFDPQPLTADVAGVNAAGQTTWLVRADGQGTVTLVQGAEGASFTYDPVMPSGIEIGGDCAFSGGNALCSGVDPEDGSIATATISQDLLPVAVGTTLPGVDITVTLSNTGPSSGPTGTPATSSSTSSGDKTSLSASAVPQKGVLVSLAFGSSAVLSLLLVST